MSDEIVAEITVKAPSTPLSRRLLVVGLRTYLTIAVPILLTLASVRLVMTPTFLQIEYTRPGFPADIYGFTTQDRLAYAPYALDYLLNGEGIEYLADLRFPDGRSLYTASELRHMRDVKVVTQVAFILAAALAIGAIAAGFNLWHSKGARSELRQGLMAGSLLTLGIIVTMVAAAIVGWDFFFAAFHSLIFESGTWRFAYSDTLIRLVPEQFWFDTAVTIGGLTTLGAVLILIVSWRSNRISPP